MQGAIKEIISTDQNIILSNVNIMGIKSDIQHKLNKMICFLIGFKHYIVVFFFIPLDSYVSNFKLRQFFQKTKIKKDSEAKQSFLPI